MTPGSSVDRQLSQRTSQHWLALIVALALIGSIIAYNLATMRHRTISQENQRLMTQARVSSVSLKQPAGP